LHLSLRVASVLLILSLAGTSLLAVPQRAPAEEAFSPNPFSTERKNEWAFARLRYRSSPDASFCARGGSRWLVDAPAAERHFTGGVQRLTRINTKTTEQFVDAASDELFKWPWIYAVEPGSWGFSDDEAKRMRDYLLKGGFLMVDDFHGTCDWAVFVAGMRRVFPDRPIEDLPDQDEIFHVLYDLDGRIQIPGAQFLYSGRKYERDGVKEKWAGIRDDKGRIVVAICHNMDLGDAWEWADSPDYPEAYTSMAYRIGINYIIYAMSH
jgi:hypothetical protein